MATSVWKGSSHLRLDLDPHSLVLGGAKRAHLAEPAPQCVQHPHPDAALLPTCDRKVERNEIVKGYEYEKDQYVLFSDEDLDKIEPESARAMEILEFVKVDEIDPLYYDASYYVTPEDEGKKAYSLLAESHAGVGLRGHRQGHHAPAGAHRGDSSAR